MKKQFTSYLLALACAGGLSGCIMHTETVEYRNPERTRVEFENDAAARMFYETMAKTHAASEKRESNTTIKIPVIFSHHSKVVEGDNIAFNDSVKECDTNQDGKITEQEARIYAELKGNHPN